MKRSRLRGRKDVVVVTTLMRTGPRKKGHQEQYQQYGMAVCRCTVYRAHVYALKVRGSETPENYK